MYGFENYQSTLSNDRRIAFSKFRCINHKLPAEKGRFDGIARGDRIYNLCNSAKLGDEYHTIFECSPFKNCYICRSVKIHCQA